MNFIKSLKNPVFISYIFSVVVQIYTIVTQHKYSFVDLSEIHKPIGEALKLEYFVSIIEFLGYIYLGFYLTNFKNLTPRRYTDWFITTNVLLVSTTFLFLYEEYLEKTSKNSKNRQIDDIQDTQPMKPVKVYDIVKRDQIIFAQILISNCIMLALGLAGEMGYISKSYAFIGGFLGFGWGFKLIYDNYASKSVAGKKQFSLFLLIWSLYGGASLLPDVSKNTAYNILDLISKNSFGMYLVYRIKSILSLDA